MKFLLFVLFSVQCGIDSCNASPFGPPYPITGSWFKDRFTKAEWNVTLREFAKQDGDTLLLRAPSMVEVDYKSFLQDPNFKWCGVNRQNTNGPDKNCAQMAVDDLKVFNMDVQAMVTYQYEEDYTPDIMIRCPQYEKRIVSDRICYRLVFPTVHDADRDQCDLNGTDVVVVFTSFAGVDPHALLLETAQDYNMSVYFGLPLPPYSNDGDKSDQVPIYLMHPYLQFLDRILQDHSTRFGKTNKMIETLKGYFWSTDVMLLVTSSHISKLTTYIELFQKIRINVHLHRKRFGIQSFIQANKFERASNISEYVDAFKALVTNACSDVISVKDGRGSGYDALYWSTQKHSTIEIVDPSLYAVLSYNYPAIKLNQTLKTFEDVFSFSINEVMSSLSDARDKMVAAGDSIDIWLNIEAFNALHDNPCLPVDRAGSGQSRMLDSVSKPHIDRVLTHCGTTTQKIVADAWDPGFTCTTNNTKTPLRNQILSDASRPIIAHCSFHSTTNRSVVVIGYNLDGQTQGFTIDWPRFNGSREVTKVYGYYFEIDWGIQHQRVPSLMYIQMYDPYDIIDLAEKGWVKVTANTGQHACVFNYDYSTDDANESKYERRKSHYRHVYRPVHKIYGQDIPFY